MKNTGQETETNKVNYDQQVSSLDFLRKNETALSHANSKTEFLKGATVRSPNIFQRLRNIGFLKTKMHNLSLFFLFSVFFVIFCGCFALFCLRKTIRIFFFGRAKKNTFRKSAPSLQNPPFANLPFSGP